MPQTKHEHVYTFYKFLKKYFEKDDVTEINIIKESGNLDGKDYDHTAKILLKDKTRNAGGRTFYHQDDCTWFPEPK